MLSDIKGELDDGTGEETESWRMAGEDSDADNLQMIDNDFVSVCWITQVIKHAQPCT